LIIPIRLNSLIDPEWLGWKILDQDEKLYLIDLLVQQQQHVLITSSQKNTIAGLVQTIQGTVTDALLRKEFEDRMGSILKHRNISINGSFWDQLILSK
jgi:hypothetical protein